MYIAQLMGHKHPQPISRQWLFFCSFLFTFENQDKILKWYFQFYLIWWVVVQMIATSYGQLWELVICLNSFIHNTNTHTELNSNFVNMHTKPSNITVIFINHISNSPSNFTHILAISKFKPYRTGILKNEKFGIKNLLEKDVWHNSKDIIPSITALLSISAHIDDLYHFILSVQLLFI